MISKLLVKYPKFEKHTFSSLEGNARNTHAHTLMHTYSCTQTEDRSQKLHSRGRV